ncbi:hypothetical protein GCM10010399_93570 [Dactylosporangium fulvum]|uniref:Uncharacterized protein n=1 Tax=Dactylosporangium fulvum TaxID=53359 RepID=A0ABY5WA38_9ACTN|nr:hypothetical protein [Dactylosporangium fulvum]UWP85889.1 hypothetical protein Dfulv_17220 [Dactylosporangium fulvum]
MSDQTAGPVPLNDRWATDEQPVKVLKAPEQPAYPPVSIEEPPASRRTTG